MPSVGKLSNIDDVYQSAREAMVCEYRSQVAGVRQENYISPADEDPTVTAAAIFFMGRLVSKGISGKRGVSMCPMRDQQANKSTMNAISPTHAEGRALMSLPSSVEDQDIILVVDKDPCRACWTMFKRYAIHRLGVASLEVIGPTFHQIFRR